MSLIALARYCSDAVRQHCWFTQHHKSEDDENLSEEEEDEPDSMHPQERLASYVFTQDVDDAILVQFFTNYLASDLEKLPRRVLIAGGGGQQPTSHNMHMFKNKHVRLSGR